MCCSHVLQAVFKAQDKRDVAINMLLCIYIYIYNYVLYFSVAQSCPTLCNPMDCRTPGFPVLHYLPEFSQTHVFWVGDASPPAWGQIPVLKGADKLSVSQGWHHYPRELCWWFGIATAISSVNIFERQAKCSTHERPGQNSSPIIGFLLVSGLQFLGRRYCHVGLGRA